MKKKILVGVAALAVIAIVGAGVAIYGYRSLNPEGQYFDSNGVKIHYTVEGKGVPVILVHGLAANGGLNWRGPRLHQKLVKEFQVITMDLRGHGRSAKPHDPKLYGKELVEDIARLMDHLKIQKAHLVGYSMGGFIVLKFAAMHPDRLYSVAPCGAGWTPDPDKDLAFLGTFADALDRGEGFGMLLERLQPVGRPVSEARIKAVSRVIAATNDFKALSAMLKSVAELRVTEAELRANTVPALAIIGERDPLKAFADQMAGAMAHIEEVVIPDGDHMSTLAKPECFKALDAFLRKNNPKQARVESTLWLPRVASASVFLGVRGFSRAFSGLA